MWPVPYIGLKAVHDQKIEEALEHTRFSTEQATPKRGRPKIFGTLLARFAKTLVHKTETTIPRPPS